MSEERQPSRRRWLRSPTLYLAVWLVLTAPFTLDLTGVQDRIDSWTSSWPTSVEVGLVVVLGALSVVTAVVAVATIVRDRRSRRRQLARRRAAGVADGRHRA